MAILLQPDEHVFFPQPYLPSEPNELVITNRRMVRITEAGMAEFPVGTVDYVGRTSRRPMVVVGIVLAVLALPLLGIGVYSVATARWGDVVKKAQELGAPPPPPLPGAAGKANDAVKKATGDDPAAAAAAAASGSDEDDEEGFVPIVDKVPAILMVLGGLILGAVGFFLARVQKHVVIARMGERALDIDCKDKGEQTMILATLSSAVSAGKMSSPSPGGAAAPAAAAPAPAIEVDDKGDPVKALQDLKGERDAGKVDDATYEAKRAILLQRLRR